MPRKAGPDSSQSNVNGPKELQKASHIPPTITVPHKDARNERCRHDDSSAFKRLAIPGMGSELLSKESNIFPRDDMTAKIPAPKLSGRRHQNLVHPDRWKGSCGSKVPMHRIAQGGEMGTCRMTLECHQVLSGPLLRLRSQMIVKGLALKTSKDRLASGVVWKLDALHEVSKRMQYKGGGLKSQKSESTSLFLDGYGARVQN